ncbi:MAG: amidohydrolase family protein, partial [Proteobacteria bacterium]|nr:amidohydrolase family protein [Pseudomonadota bacterium]
MNIAFIDGPVFVGDGRILEQATVLVDGERIVKVAQGNVAVPNDARKVSLAGMTLLPGIIDCHVHLCLDAGPDPITSIIRESQSMIALK